MRRLLVVISILSGLSGLVRAADANAQETTASAADALFQSGKSAMESGDYRTACERFRESFRLQAAVGTLLNLGACEEKRGHYAVGLQCFRDALSMLGDGDFRRGYAEERLTALRARVAFVHVMFDGAVPSDLRLRQDGVDLGASSLGVEFSVDPGEHVFEASAAGFAPSRTVVTVAEKEHREVTLRLSPAPLSGAREDHSAPAREPGKLGPYLLMGTGGAAMIAGAIFGLVVASEASDVHDHCTGSICDDDGLSAARRGKPYAVLSPVFLGAGAALAIGGFVWLKVSSRARVSPVVSAASPNAGVSMTVQF